MDKPVSQRQEPEEQTMTPAQVWERLDPAARARVIELFAHSAYNFVIAQHEVAAQEDSDVSSRRDAEGHGGAH